MLHRSAFFPQSTNEFHCLSGSFGFENTCFSFVQRPQKALSTLTHRIHTHMEHVRVRGSGPAAPKESWDGTMIEQQKKEHQCRFHREHLFLFCAATTQSNPNARAQHKYTYVTCKSERKQARSAKKELGWHNDRATKKRKPKTTNFNSNMYTHQQRG